MDLANFDTISAAEKGMTYTVTVPFGDDKGKDSDITIDILGAGCKAYDDAQAAIDAYQNKCWSKGKDVDKEHLSKLQIDLVVSCTKGWQNMEEGGKALPFSRENAFKAYKGYPWLVMQVLKAMGDFDTMLSVK